MKFGFESSRTIKNYIVEERRTEDYVSVRFYCPKTLNTHEHVCVPLSVNIPFTFFSTEPRLVSGNSGKGMKKWGYVHRGREAAILVSHT